MSEREYYRRRDKRLSYDLDERSKEPSENIVKTYPSLSYGTDSHLPIYAFDKLDGSNIRAEWSSKKGWYKLGTRHRLLDASDPLFGKVPDLLAKGLGDPIARALREAGYDRAMCFFEFWGQKSFAGMHDLTDPTLKLTLIDVAPFAQGILMPDKFIELFGHLDAAKLLYRGRITPEFIERVRAGTLEGMTFEGVVCKAINDKKTKMPVMFKQKSRAWLDKLHKYCGDNRELFNALI